jgi:hypothetical protein
MKEITASGARQLSSDEIAEVNRLIAECQEQDDKPRGGLRSPEGVCYHDWVDEGLYIFNDRHKQVPVAQCTKCGLLRVYNGR